MAFVCGCQSSRSERHLTYVSLCGTLAMSEKNALKDRQKAHYESLLDNYKERLKEFRHKDQKPYWT